MKNIVLIMVDQMRFDALGRYNTKVQTPHLNHMANLGYSFTHAYSATPTCVPARAALMTGLKQSNHKRVGYEDGIEWDYEKTIAGEFAKNGYYSKAIGKMHVYPPRKLMGFHHVELHDGYLHHSRKYNKEYSGQFEMVDDYLAWFKEKKGIQYDLTDSGLDCNSWVVRPWMYEEEYHPTNWVVSRGLHFLKTKDPTKPFFLKLSFTRPHSPLDPPEYYFNLYKDTNFNETESEFRWSDQAKLSKRTYEIDALRGSITDKEKNDMIAAYYGHITHIDHQIGRFLMGMQEHDLEKDTIYLFVSDHGDQLGEHFLFRKAYPYQGSVHIPFIVYDPSNHLEGKRGSDVEELTELKDIFPTLFEMATGKSVESVDGKSVVDAIKKTGTQSAKRENDKAYVHGEHSFGDYSSQFIITKTYKYIWFSNANKEQLFNLEIDPKETNNLADSASHSHVLKDLRDILIKELEGREEGFVENGSLVSGRAKLSYLKGEENDKGK